MSSTIPRSPEFDIDTSEAPLVIDVLTVILIFTTAIVTLRFIAKWIFKVPFSCEDWLILGASILADSLLVMFIKSASTQELGRHSDLNGPNAQTSFRKKLYSSVPVSILANGFTKLSILAFYYRLFSSSSQTMKVLLQVTVGVVICGGTGFFIASVFQCNPIYKVWDTVAEGTCINTYVFFLFNAAFNIITNFVLLVLPLPTIWKLQMKKQTKVELCCLLTLGGLIIIISGLRLRSLLHLNPTFADVTWKMTRPIIWSCVEMQIDISCACLPFLRKLLIKLFQMLQAIAVTPFLSRQHSRQSIRSQEPTPGHGSLEELKNIIQKTFTTCEWPGRAQTKDEEKGQNVVKEDRRIMVTTVIELSTE